MSPFQTRYVGYKVEPKGPKDEDHPLLVMAKKELLGTDNSTTLEQVVVP